LSYSTFDYGELDLDQKLLSGEGAALEARVTVRNTSSVAAEEIVQLYISDPVASRSRPARELKGFRKIQLKPGEQQVVRFNVTLEQLRFFRANDLAEFQRIWEPGKFVIQVGPHSQILSTDCIEWRADE
jgi:beta-glucosidase